MTVNLLVSIKTKPGHSTEFDELFSREFIKRSRTEEGCLEYRLWTDLVDPQEKVIVECWAHQEHFEAHLEQAWFKRCSPEMEALLEVPPAARFFFDAG